MTCKSYPAVWISNYYPLLFRHVQISNDEALQFYNKFGFKIIDTKQEYYKRIEPADAYVLEKSLKGGKVENVS